MIVIGIDIGLTGAVAAVDSRGTATVRDIPLIPDGKPRQRVNKKTGKKSEQQSYRIDGRALIFAIREIVPIGHPALVVFEDVHARSIGSGGRATNSMGSQGSMMRSRGIVEGVIDITRLECKAVQPQTWKRHFGLLLKREEGEEDSDFDRRKKAASMDTARGLFPAIGHDLKRVKDHNRAEALLLAQFGLNKDA